MRAIAAETVKKRGAIALSLCALAIVLVIALLSLPVCEFTTTLMTKRSGNTFVGDERYVAARAEADAAAAEYEAHGGYGAVTVSEEVIERVNSKGEKTSMVAFTVAAKAARTGWQFIGSGLLPGRVLLALLALSLLAALLGVYSALDFAPRDPLSPLAGRGKARFAACWLALLALALVPVFCMSAVHVFERQLILRLSLKNDAPAPALLALADAFLYGGTAGETIGALLPGLTYHSTWSLWAIMPTLAVMLAGLIVSYRGALKHALARGLLYLFVISLCVIILYPYYVMLITGFRSNVETTDMFFTRMFPSRWVWSNIADIVNRGILRYLGNTVLLSGGATIVALCCGIPAAYAMARMSFKGKKAFLGFVIMSQMFAPVVLLVGISQLMNFLKLNDSVTGLMLINAAFNQAFAIWLLRGTFVSISPEMEQAACIDGCSTFKALVRVLLPMAAPGIVTTLIFVFINAWNEYTISTVLISTAAKKPLTVGITQFSSFNMIEWQYLFASALLATIPVVILFMFIEKHLVAGLTSGGVKG